MEKLCKTCEFFIPLNACQLSPITAFPLYSCGKYTEDGKLDKLKSDIDEEIKSLSKIVEGKVDKT